MADKYEFLSPEWVAAAKKIQEESPKPENPPAHSMKANLNITEVPFGDSDIEAFLDTSDGETRMDLGRLDAPELTITVDYATAKAIFIDQNPQAGMQAFMAGKVKVQGDMTKLMAMQQGAPDPAAQAVAAQIKEITA